MNEQKIKLFIFFAFLGGFSGYMSSFWAISIVPGLIFGFFVALGYHYATFIGQNKSIPDISKTLFYIFLSCAAHLLAMVIHINLMILGDIIKIDPDHLKTFTMVIGGSVGGYVVAYATKICLFDLKSHHFIGLGIAGGLSIFPGSIALRMFSGEVAMPPISLDVSDDARIVFYVGWQAIMASLLALCAPLPADTGIPYPVPKDGGGQISL